MVSACCDLSACASLLREKKKQKTTQNPFRLSVQEQAFNPERVLVALAGGG